MYLYIKFCEMPYTAAQKAAYYKRKSRSAIKGRGDYVSISSKKRPAVSRAISRVMPKRLAPRRTIKGRGDYASAIKTGGNIGSEIGGALGKVGGAIWNFLSGNGDYTVKSNCLINMGTPVPSFGDSSRSNIVEHREYITDITSSVDFKNRVYPINPGATSSFPWLANIAQNYEQYKLLGMVYMFKSTSATALNSTNTALGTVIMSTQYDVNRPLFTNKQEMENHEFTTMCKPAESVLHPIECAPSETSLNLKFTRTDAAVNSANLNFYDHGNFQLATVGSQAEAVIGELWVTYVVQFFKPAFNTWSKSYAHYSFTPENSGFTGNPAQIMGNIPRPAPEPGSSISITVGNSVTKNAIVFDDNVAPGSYLVAYYCYGNSAVLTDSLGIDAAGARINTMNIMADGTLPAYSEGGGTTTVQYIIFAIEIMPYQNANGQAFIQFPNAVSLPGDPYPPDLFITYLGSITT